MDWHRSLQDLRKELSVHEGYPCITLTMPTARNMPDNAQDPVRLKNLVNQAKARLQDELGKRAAAAAIANLEHAANEVDHDRNYEGLAIFANETAEFTLKTRFAMPENLHIDDRFSLRTVIRAERRAEPYCVLVLALDEAKLFEGQREDLYEVRTGGFPNRNPNAGAGSKVPGGLGVDSTAAVDESRRMFVVDCIQKYRAMDELPKSLVVVGTPAVLAEAQQAEGNDFQIAGIVSGNLLGAHPAEIGAKAWQALRETRRSMSEKIVASLDSARSANKYAVGAQSLAPLAYEGRIELLVCGMEYQVAGRVDPATGQLELLDTPESWRDVDDAVDWIVQRVLETGGEVRYVEDGLLGDPPIVGVVRY